MTLEYNEIIAYIKLREQAMEYFNEFIKEYTNEISAYFSCVSVSGHETLTLRGTNALSGQQYCIEIPKEFLNSPHLLRKHNGLITLESNRQETEEQIAQLKRQIKTLETENDTDPR